jgi:hypothetical protein
VVSDDILPNRSTLVSKIRQFVKGEPVAIVGSLVTAYHAGVAAALEFGLVHWTVKEVTSAEAFVVAVLAIPVTIFVRNRVSPTDA